MIQLVVAASENNAIGFSGKMPWHLPRDLKFFKEKTMGHPIVMGRKTFESIGRPLPGRLNCIISRQSGIQSEQLRYFTSLTDCLNTLQEEGHNLISIVGGGQIYQQSITLADVIWLTRVHTIIAEADTYFPEIDENTWTLESEEHVPKDDKHAFDLTFQKWIKRPS